MPRRGAGTEGESQSNKDQFHIFHDCNELGGFKIICRLMTAVSFFYWSIIALHGCVHVCCRNKWISCMHTYLPSLLDPLITPIPPHWISTEHRAELPVLRPLSSSGLFYTGSVRLSILISQAVPPASPLPVSICPFSNVRVSSPALQLGSSVPFS